VRSEPREYRILVKVRPIQARQAAVFKTFKSATFRKRTALSVSRLNRLLCRSHSIRAGKLEVRPLYFLF
jgi:hypothetical protein